MPATPPLLGMLQQAHEALRRVCARPSIRFGWFALLALLATWPLLSTAGGLNDFRDAHVLLQYEESARRTVTEFGQLPLWNPYYCGGMYGWGTPQSRFASPTFLLTVLFGPVRAESLIAFLMVLLGSEGAFRYLRARGARSVGALLGAPTFSLSGIFACSPALGWTNFFSFALLPWAAYGARRALRGSPAGSVITAAAFAWMVGFGGTYAVPLAAILCAGELIERSLRRPRHPPVLPAIATASLSLTACAFRLWPIAETLHRAPRIMGGLSGQGWLEVLGLLFGSPPFLSTGVWYLIGLLTVPAAMAGAFARRRIPLLIGIAACAWLATGYSVRPSLFALLRKLPVYEALRYPERFLVPLALLVAALCALGVSRWSALARRRPRAVLGWALLALLLLANLPVLVGNFFGSAKSRTLVPPPPVMEREFHQARGNRWALAYFGPMSRGSLSCWDAYPVPQSPALRADLIDEEYLLDPTSGSVRRSSWSPNRIDLDVRLERPGRVLVNQNHHAGWRSNVGEVVSHDGLLAVALPPGEHSVTLRFLPRSALGGLFTSLVAALCGGAILWRRRRLRRWELVAWAVGPAIAAGAAFVFLPEPAWSRPPLRTPTGENVVADGPAPGATRLEVQLEGGIVLEAVRTHFVADEQGTRIIHEADWRLTRQPPPGLGFFLHVQPDEGDRLTADHPLVSGVLRLDDAPIGKTLRDVVVIQIPPKLAQREWKLWAGLWAVFGDGARVKVVHPGSATVRDDRVLVGEVQPVIRPGGWR